VAKFFSFLQICQAMHRVRYLQYPLGSVQVQHSLQYPWLYFWQMEKAFRFGWLMQFMGLSCPMNSGFEVFPPGGGSPLPVPRSPTAGAGVWCEQGSDFPAQILSRCFFHFHMVNPFHF